jgi:hypothetical protein
MSCAEQAQELTELLATRPERGRARAEPLATSAPDARVLATRFARVADLCKSRHAKYRDATLP